MHGPTVGMTPQAGSPSASSLPRSTVLCCSDASQGAYKQIVYKFTYTANLTPKCQPLVTSAARTCRFKTALLGQGGHGRFSEMVQH
jgi:hypothetical protein